jgi:hypothetical protein
MNSTVPADSYFSSRAISKAQFDISWRIEDDNHMDGDSSTIFWWRRWIEHSRSKRLTKVSPSPKTCISMCLPLSMYFSIRQCPEPKERSASEVHLMRASLNLEKSQISHL